MSIRWIWSRELTTISTFSKNDGFFHVSEENQHDLVAATDLFPFVNQCPLLRESVTHWPINWQSALIPSSSQELFFLFLSFCVSTGREPCASSRNTSFSHDCHWFHLEPFAEENAAASFTHASYKPRTNILTSDTKGILSHSHSFTPTKIINLCCVV